jgi:hypothetical protein
MDVFQRFGEIKSIDLRSGPEYFNGQQIAWVFLTSLINNVELYAKITCTCSKFHLVVFLNIFYSFVRFPKEEMAKYAVDSLLRNPVENVKLQVEYSWMQLPDISRKVTNSCY